jgi:hypothetical protein
VSYGPGYRARTRAVLLWTAVVLAACLAGGAGGFLAGMVVSPGQPAPYPAVFTPSPVASHP